MSTAGILLVALVIAIGLAGIIVPVLPGGLLVIAAIGVWAFVESSAVSWVVFGIAAAVFAAAEVVKYTWPVKRMRRADVRTSVLFIGAIVGFVGFFVIPVVGLLIGFIAGVFVAEVAIRRDLTRAWASTVHALKGVALSVGVELTGALLATVAWVIGVWIIHV
ncbi:membrane protein [Mycolicibacterium cyprinidarum]|uniref:Membrane protein n=1 Tax=Mycolicibacterium cyprinidarum TaxID=2860311 RepID=A0ABQ4VA28_9MYCO|nr:membrane protein [Mycolicibacterium sp. NGTWS1803]GJF15282.1 membrane protein [Mycolicibacterium sp. NGTWSNA01]GJF16400.1 membrane protein [Mycolicibacterium sp. NGTWS0302]